MGGGAGGDARGRGRQRRPLPAARAGRPAARTRSARALLLELGAAEALTSGPAGGGAPGARLRGADGSRAARRRSRPAGPGADLHRRPRRRRPRSRGGPRRSCRTTLEDLRRGLEAMEFMTIYFGAGDPGSLRRLRDLPPSAGGGPGLPHARGDGRVGGGLQRRHRRRVRRAGPRRARGRPAARRRSRADLVRGHRHAGHDRPPGGRRDLPRRPSRTRTAAARWSPPGRRTSGTASASCGAATWRRRRSRSGPPRASCGCGATPAPPSTLSHCFLAEVPARARSHGRGRPPARAAGNRRPGPEHDGLVARARASRCSRAAGRAEEAVGRGGRARRSTARRCPTPRGSGGGR